MPIIELQSPTGETAKVEVDRMPSDAEIDEISASVFKPQRSEAEKQRIGSLYYPLPGDTVDKTPVDTALKAEAGLQEVTPLPPTDTGGNLVPGSFGPSITQREFTEGWKGLGQAVERGRARLKDKSYDLGVRGPDAPGKDWAPGFPALSPEETELAQVTAAPGEPTSGDLAYEAMTSKWSRPAHWLSDAAVASTSLAQDVAAASATGPLAPLTFATIMAADPKEGFKGKNFLMGIAMPIGGKIGGYLLPKVVRAVGKPMSETLETMEKLGHIGGAFAPIVVEGVAGIMSLPPEERWNAFLEESAAWAPMAVASGATQRRGGDWKHRYPVDRDPDLRGLRLALLEPLAKRGMPEAKVEFDAITADLERSPMHPQDQVVLDQHLTPPNLGGGQIPHTYRKLPGSSYMRWNRDSGIVEIDPQHLSELMQWQRSRGMTEVEVGEWVKRSINEEQTHAKFTKEQAARIGAKMSSADKKLMRAVYAGDDKAELTDIQYGDEFIRYLAQKASGMGAREFAEMAIGEQIKSKTLDAVSQVYSEVSNLFGKDPSARSTAELLNRVSQRVAEAEEAAAVATEGKVKPNGEVQGKEKEVTKTGAGEKPASSLQKFQEVREIPEPSRYLTAFEETAASGASTVEQVRDYWRQSTGKEMSRERAREMLRGAQGVQFSLELATAFKETQEFRRLKHAAEVENQGPFAMQRGTPEEAIKYELEQTIKAAADYREKGAYTEAAFEDEMARFLKQKLDDLGQQSFPAAGWRKDFTKDKPVSDLVRRHALMPSTEWQLDNNMKGQMLALFKDKAGTTASREYILRDEMEKRAFELNDLNGKLDDHRERGEEAQAAELEPVIRQKSDELLKLRHLSRNLPNEGMIFSATPSDARTGTQQEFPESRKRRDTTTPELPMGIVDSAKDVKGPTWPVSLERMAGAKGTETFTPGVGNIAWTTDADTGKLEAVRYDGVRGYLSVDNRPIHKYTWITGPSEGTKGESYSRTFWRPTDIELRHQAAGTPFTEAQRQMHNYRLESAQRASETLKYRNAIAEAGVKPPGADEESPAARTRRKLEGIGQSDLLGFTRDVTGKFKLPGDMEGGKVIKEEERAPVKHEFKSAETGEPFPSPKTLAGMSEADALDAVQKFMGERFKVEIRPDFHEMVDEINSEFGAELKDVQLRRIWEDTLLNHLSKAPGSQILSMLKSQRLGRQVNIWKPVPDEIIDAPSGELPVGPIIKGKAIKSAVRRAELASEKQEQYQNELSRARWLMDKMAQIDPKYVDVSVDGRPIERQEIAIPDGTKIIRHRIAKDAPDSIKTLARSVDEARTRADNMLPGSKDPKSKDPKKPLTDEDIKMAPPAFQPGTSVTPEPAFTHSQRRRATAISEIFNALVAKAEAGRKPVDRATVDPDEISTTKLTENPPFISIPQNIADNPKAVGEMLVGKGSGARVSAGQAVSNTRRLVVIQAKKGGRVYLVDAFNDGERGPVINLPMPAGKVKDSHVPFTQAMRDYRFVRGVLVSDPVKNFRMNFRSLEEFNRKWGYPARAIAESQAEIQSVVERESYDLNEVAAQKNIGEVERAEGAPMTRQEAEAIHTRLIEEGVSNPEQVKERWMQLGSQADAIEIAGLRKLGRELFKENPQLTQEEQLNLLAQRLYENTTTTKGFDTGVQRTMAQGGAKAGEPVPAPFTSETARDISAPRAANVIRGGVDPVAELTRKRIAAGAEEANRKAEKRAIDLVQRISRRPMEAPRGLDKSILDTGQWIAKEPERYKAWLDSRATNPDGTKSYMPKETYTVKDIIKASEAGVQRSIEKAIAEGKRDPTEKSDIADVIESLELGQETLLSGEDAPAAMRRKVGEFISGTALGFASFYDEPMIDRMYRLGGPNAKDFAVGLRAEVDRVKELKGQMSSFMDPAMTVAGGAKVLPIAGQVPSPKNIRGVAWLTGKEQVNQWGAVSRMFDAVEGVMHPRLIPGYAREAWSSLSDANLQIGNVLAPVAPGFVPTGKLQRNITSLGYDAILRGAGELHDNWVKAQAQLTGTTEAVIRNYFRAWGEELAKDAPDTAKMDKIAQDFSRRWPRVVTHVKVGKVWQEVIHSNPYNYLRNAADRAAHIRAFREQFPATQQGRAAWSQMMKDVRNEIRMSGSELLPELRALNRTIQGRPTDAYNSTVFNPTSVPGQLFRMANATVGNLMAKMVLTGQMMTQAGETMAGATPATLGYHNYIRGLARLRQLYPQLETEGSVNRVMHDFTYDQSGPVRSAFRMAGNVTGKLFAEQFLNELQEGAAAATAHVVAERIGAGTLSGWERRQLPQTFKAMGFSDAEARAMMLGDPELLMQFKRKAATWLTSGNRDIAEGSRLGSNRLFNSIFRFQSYPMMRLQQARRMISKTAEAWGENRADKWAATEQLTRHLFFGTMQGALTMAVAAAFASGGLYGAQQVARRGRNEPDDFVAEAAMSAYGGPSYLLWRNAQRKGMFGLGEEVLNMVFPFSIAREIIDMSTGQGRYKDAGLLDRIAMFAKSKTPGTKMIAGALAMAGLSKDEGESKRLATDIANFNKWRTKKYGWSEVHEYGPKSDSSEFRGYMKKAVEALAKGDQAEALRFTEQAYGAGMRDKEQSPKDSLMRRKKLLIDNRTPTEEEMIEMRAALGDEAVNRLQRYDDLLESIADLY